VRTPGGAAGRGREVARLRVGDNGGVAGSRDVAKRERAAAGLDGLGTARLDVTSEEASRAALGAAVERLGGLDFLINSAGVLQPVPFEDAAAGPAMEAADAVNL